MSKTEEIENSLWKFGRLFGEKEGASWLVGDEPFRLNKVEKEKIRELGERLQQFLTQCKESYQQESRLRGTLREGLPAQYWKIIEALNESPPLIIRPDIVIDSEGGFHLAEIEVDPAGLGISQALYEAYQETGFRLWPKKSPAEIFAEKISDSVIFSTFSWRPYASEQKLFASRVNHFGSRSQYLPVEEWRKLDGVTLVYRLMTPEMVSQIPVIPKNPITPPFLFEWKGWLAVNNGVLAEIPESQLFPLSEEYKITIRDLTASQRKFIIKPVFSSGGKGLIDCQKITTTQWKNIIEDPARNSLYILQKKIDSQEYGFPVAGKIMEKLKIRLSPFYLMRDSKTEILAVIVTLRNNLKVHGATDAIFVPSS